VSRTLRLNFFVHYLTPAIRCRLSKDLYNKKTHFILEFIQNADDNHYAGTESPSLRLVIEDRQITIQCNEVGFREANVEAICDVGQSTKTNAVGYIGENSLLYSSCIRRSN